MNLFVTDDDPHASPFGQGSRLMLFPAIVGLLFAGAVYWLQFQLHRSPGQAEPTAVVEVRLLPRPDPLPIPVNPASQSTAVNATNPGNAPTGTPADRPRNTLAALPVEGTLSSEAAAKQQHLQGTVLAVFSVGRDGKLLGAWVKTSSGQAVLDQAAIDTIRRAEPLPQIPPALPDSMTVEVALGFDPS
jgi:protein TonB